MEAGRNRRWRLVILGSSIVMYLVSSLYGLLHGFEDPLQGWNGYYTLVVAKSVPLEQIDTQLAGEGLADAMSLNTVLVDISDFKGTEYIPYSRVRERLGDLDPRLDTWLRSLDSWFSDAGGKNWVVYLPARESIAALMLRLSSALGPLQTQWQLVEWHPLERVILLGAALLAALFVLIASPKRRMITVLSLVCWVPLAASAGPAFFPLHIVLLVLWCLLLESIIPALKRYAHDVPQAPFFWDNPADIGAVKESLKGLAPFLDQGAIKIRLFMYLTCLLLYTALSVASGHADLLPGLLLVQVFAWPGLLLLLSRIFQIRHRRSEHRLFAPVPMITRGGVFRTKLRIAVPFLAVTGFLPAIVFGFIPGSGEAAGLPHPGGKLYGGLSYAAALRAHADAGRVSSVPDMSDYIAHRAFQDGLPYMKDHRFETFSLPAAGTELGVERFGEQSGKTETWMESKVKFDDGWLSGVIGSMPRNSIERMLADQGQVVALVSTASGALYSNGAWSLPSLAGLAALLVPIWFLGRDPGIKQFYGTRRYPAGGRKLAA